MFAVGEGLGGDRGGEGEAGDVFGEGEGEVDGAVDS